MASSTRSTYRSRGPTRFSSTIRGATTGSATVSLHDVPADLADTIAFGSTKTFTTTVPGQNARVTFQGTAGQRAAVRISGSCCTTRVSILRPDGSTLSSLAAFASIDGFLEPVTLPSTGTYTVLLDPDAASTGSVTLSLYDVPPDVTDTITAGSPLRVTIGTPGQNARVAFAGTAGQEVSLRLTDVTIGSIVSGTTVSLLRPDGTTLASAIVGTNGGFLDGRTLAVTGTYTVLVDPAGANTGGLTLALEEVPLRHRRHDCPRRGAGDGDDVRPGSGRPPHLQRHRRAAGEPQSGPELLRRPCVRHVAERLDAGRRDHLRNLGSLHRRDDAPESGTFTILVDYDGSSTGAVT